MTVGDFIRTLQELVDRRVITDSTNMSARVCRLVWHVWALPRIEAMRAELAAPMPAPSVLSEAELAAEVAAEMEKL